MGKKFIVLLTILTLIFLEIYFKIFSVIITGFTSLSLNIQSLKEACIILFPTPAIMSPSESFNFTTELWNCGSSELENTTIELSVKNETGGIVFLVNESSPTSMDIDERRILTANYTANQSFGNYTFVARGYYDGQIVETSRAFQIKYPLTLEILVDGTTSPAIPIHCTGESVNVTNILGNVGIEDVTGNLSTRIFDSIGSEIHNDNWSDIFLPVDEVKAYMTYYTIEETDNAGLANVGGNFTFGGNITYSSRQFRINKGIGNFYLSPNEIEKTIRPGDYDDTGVITLWLENNCQGANVTMNKSTGIPGDWVNFTRGEVFLPDESPINQTIANISVPSSTSEGDYTGTIYANADGTQIPLELKVHVQGIAFTLNVTVPPEDKAVCAGDYVSALVGIERNQAGLDDVNMTYRILDNVGTSLAELNKTLSVNTSLIDNPTLTVSSSASAGTHTFLAILRFNDTQTQSSDVFYVSECIPTTTAPTAGPAPSPPVAPTPLVYSISLDLSTDVLSVIVGNGTSFIAFVNNTGTGKVTSVKISITGISPDWWYVIPYIADISPGQMKEYQVAINVPYETLPGVYILSVQATDSVSSEIRDVTLVVGKDPKELAGLLLSELKKLKATANTTLTVGKCINISDIVSLYVDAEKVYENGIKEYEKENYVEAINWFEIAVTNYKKVIFRVDVAIKSEIESLKISELFAPISEQQLNLVKKYLAEKNYEKICEPISQIKRLILYGFVFWPILILLIIISIIIFIVVLKKHGWRKKEKILEKIKERMGEKKDIS